MPGNAPHWRRTVQTKMRGHVAMSRLLSRQSRLPPGKDNSRTLMQLFEALTASWCRRIRLRCHCTFAPIYRPSDTLQRPMSPVFFVPGPPQASQKHGRQDDSRPATSTSTDEAFASVKSKGIHLAFGHKASCKLCLPRPQTPK